MHSDRGTQTRLNRWKRHRLREAGLLGSMGRVASWVDNGLMESFWSTMQRELLDRRTWTTRAELGSAIFEWIEGFYNPTRRATPPWATTPQRTTRSCTRPRSPRRPDHPPEPSGKRSSSKLRFQWVVLSVGGHVGQVCLNLADDLLGRLTPGVPPAGRGSVRGASDPVGHAARSAGRRCLGGRVSGGQRS